MRSGQIEKSDDEEVTGSFVNGHLEVFKNDEKLSSFRRFRKRLKDDQVYRRKFMIFICICYDFIVLGVNGGQFGPTLLDLQLITGSRFENASFFFNATTIGYLFASLAVGLIFDRFNKLILMCLPTLCLAGVVATLPWCSIYELMVFMHFLKGFFMGIIDGVGNALLLHLLTLEVKTYMQILHFMFAFGGIISPIISAPFLTSEESLTVNQTHSILPEVNVSNITESPYPMSTLSWMSNNRSAMGNDVTTESEVYKAYTITALLTLISGISFAFLYCRSDESSCPTSNTDNEEHKSENVPKRIKIFGLVVLCIIIASYTAMEDTYAGFLTTFTVKHYHWSKSDGAFATSVFWTSFAVGRFCGIFIVNLVGQAKLLFTYSLTIIIAYIFLLLTSVFQISEGIWIASAIIGFGMSIFFPIFFSWTEAKFFHVDGKVTAVIMACASLGVIINPIILSRVMNAAPVWFCYVQSAESILLMVVLILAFYIANLVKKESSSLAKEITIEVTQELKSDSNENTDL